MEEILRSTFQIGQNVEVYLSGGIEPLRGELVGIHPGVIVVRTASGGMRLTRIEYIIDIRSVGISDAGACAGSDIVTDGGEAIRPVTYADMPETESDCGDDAVGEYEEERPRNAEDGMADGNAGHGETDDDGNYRIPEIEIFSNTPKLSVPTVLGKINLDEINDPRGKKKVRFADRQKEEDYADEKPTDNSDRMMPVCGYVNRLRENDFFGFIRLVGDEETPIYFHRNEILLEADSDTCPAENDPVIFTLGHNQKGRVAKCVHRQCTVGQMYDLIERISDYDPRNARLLRLQLKESGLVEDDGIDDNHFHTRQYRRDNYGNYGYGRDSRNYQGYVREPLRQRQQSPFMEKEKWASGALDYNDYMTFVLNLIEECEHEQPKQCYPLYTRVIKKARENFDDEQAYELIDRALAFYGDEESGTRAYFERLKGKIAQASSLRMPGSLESNDSGADMHVDDCSRPVSRSSIASAASSSSLSSPSGNDGMQDSQAQSSGQEAAAADD